MTGESDKKEENVNFFLNGSDRLDRKSVSELNQRASHLVRSKTRAGPLTRNERSRASHIVIIFQRVQTQRRRMTARVTQRFWCCRRTNVLSEQVLVVQVRRTISERRWNKLAKCPERAYNYSTESNGGIWRQHSCHPPPAHLNLPSTHLRHTLSPVGCKTTVNTELNTNWMPARPTSVDKRS
jgi:hypothetical protein